MLCILIVIYSSFYSSVCCQTLSFWLFNKNVRQVYVYCDSVVHLLWLFVVYSRCMPFNIVWTKSTFCSGVSSFCRPSVFLKRFDTVVFKQLLGSLLGSIWDRFCIGMCGFLIAVWHNSSSVDYFVEHWIRCKDVLCSSNMWSSLFVDYSNNSCLLFRKAYILNRFASADDKDGVIPPIYFFCKTCRTGYYISLFDLNNIKEFHREFSWWNCFFAGWIFAARFQF